jgi:hypothetical protein
MTFFDYEKIVDQLRKNVLEVTFTKVNGEERIMACTLLTEYMPELSGDKVSRVEANSANRSVVRAYSIDSQDWRSFRVDSVSNIEVING